MKSNIFAITGYSLYIWDRVWIVKLIRIFAPLQAVMFPSKRAVHTRTPLFGVQFILFKNQPQGQQKAVVPAMFSRQKIHAMIYSLSTWSVIPERVSYANVRPVPDRDAKRHLKFKVRLSQSFEFQNWLISPDRMSCAIN